MQGELNALINSYLRRSTKDFKMKQISKANQNKHKCNWWDIKKKKAEEISIRLKEVPGGKGPKLYRRQFRPKIILEGSMPPSSLVSAGLC